MAGAVIALDGHHLHANSLGRASVTLRFMRAGRIQVRVAADGYLSTTGTIHVVANADRSNKGEAHGNGGDRDGDAD